MSLIFSRVILQECNLKNFETSDFDCSALEFLHVLPSWLNNLLSPKARD